MYRIEISRVDAHGVGLGPLWLLDEDGRPEEYETADDAQERIASFGDCPGIDGYRLDVVWHGRPDGSAIIL